MKFFRYLSNLIFGSLIPFLLGYNLTVRYIYDPYILLFSIVYVISIVLAIIYFKVMKSKWWYGLISPIIGGLVTALLIYIFTIGYFIVHGGPSF